jgi:type IV pilus assembly protein PilC
MTYPVAVLGLVVLIMVAMLVFVVPTFKHLYDSLGGKLPMPTQILLKISGFVTGFFPFIIVGTVAAIWGFRRWIGSDDGRARWDVIKLKVPIFGSLIRKTAITRFARTLSVLLRAGVPILETLEITSDTVNNSVVSKATLDIQDAVKRGESLSAPLANHPIFPPMVTQMMAVGEETGALDAMLEKLSDFYDQEIEATVDALTSLLEPLLIAVLGIAVGGMVIALYMPMFNIINLVK